MFFIRSPNLVEISLTFLRYGLVCYHKMRLPPSWILRLINFNIILVTIGMAMLISLQNLDLISYTYTILQVFLTIIKDGGYHSEFHWKYTYGIVMRVKLCRRPTSKFSYIQTWFKYLQLFVRDRGCLYIYDSDAVSLPNRQRVRENDRPPTKTV